MGGVQGLSRGRSGERSDGGEASSSAPRAPLLLLLSPCTLLSTAQFAYISRLSLKSAHPVRQAHLMALPATQIRRGMVIVFEGRPCRIIEFRHHTPGNLPAMVQAKLKDLTSGSNFEHRFRADDSIEKASMETHELQFMYKRGDTYHFMNTENYDQLEMDKETLGDNAPGRAGN